jgi:hypothetical protein
MNVNLRKLLEEFEGKFEKEEIVTMWKFWKKNLIFPLSIFFGLITLIISVFKNYNKTFQFNMHIL